MSNISQPGALSKPSGDAWSRIARRIRVPLGFVFAVVYILLARPSKLSLITGTLVLLPGLLLRGVASGYVQKNEQLTRGGPYAHTRNPLYLGSLLLGAGFAIASRNGWIFGLMMLMFAVIYVPVIGGEERYLRQQFPEYENYARNVPRLWPRFTPYGRQPGEYSSARYWKHREYRASMGCLVVLAILVVKLILKPVW